MNDYQAYSGFVGRAQVKYPQIDIAGLFAEKKARIIAQGAKFIYLDETPQVVKDFLNQFEPEEILSNCIQQASMNGYAIVDIQRQFSKDTAGISTAIYTNPFPSVYDNWLIETSTRNFLAVTYETCPTHQRYITPNYAVVTKDLHGLAILGTAGMQIPFMVGAINWIPLEDDMKLQLPQKVEFGAYLKYEDIVTPDGTHVWPIVPNREHLPFLVFQNKRFQLGWDNMVQNSDWWFIQTIMPLIPSYLERMYQEQETNITRVVGNFDPTAQTELWEQAKFTNGSINEKMLFNTPNSFSNKRAFNFTIGDGQTITPYPSTFNGESEIAGLKDYIDLLFKFACGFEMFGESATRESTATENLQRSVSERETILELSIWYKEQLLQIFKSALYFQFGKDFDGYFDIELQSARGNATPTEISTYISQYQSGLLSLDLAVRKCNPMMSEMELQQELALIREQQQTQQQDVNGLSSMAEPEQTSQLELEENNGH